MSPPSVCRGIYTDYGDTFDTDLTGTICYGTEREREGRDGERQRETEGETDTHKERDGETEREIT